MLWECIHRESGQRYCVKIFDRRRLSVQEQKAVEREIALLQNAQGDVGIVQVLDVINESEKVYIIMEHMTGGNLLSKVVQQEGRMCESTVKLIAKSLLLGVQHLHKLDICHNGLDPSNILLDVTDSAKIGDFGHATRMGYLGTGAPGTAAYMAPEVLQGGAPTAASDMWSIGVLLYFCLFGQTPFADQSAASGRTSVSRIHKAEYSFPTTEWNHVPRYAKQLISSLIHIDPTVRLTADEALQHPWFADPVVVPVHYRRPRRIRIFVQCLWEKMSLCRKKKDDANVKTLASLSTNSSSPFSSEQSITRGHRAGESSGSMSRFYDIDE
jgi:serine/threonine protein kinase